MLRSHLCLCLVLVACDGPAPVLPDGGPFADSDGDELEYFVAPAENKVPGVLLASPSSPLGAALLGARVGDEVAYEAPAGTFTMKVTGIRPYAG